MSKLSIVATPIGNLEDITFRAVRTLKEADVILCEDPRVTKKLTDKYEISTQLKKFNDHASPRQLQVVLEMLENDLNVALVSDAGTPGVSDPGALLVQSVRSVLPDVRIEPIPGPSALSATLSVAGVRHTDFTFLGFLPHKKGREKIFKEIACSERTTVFFESSHRILRTLTSLVEHLEARPVVLAREITKIHEDILSGTASEILAYLNTNTQKQKGEFVVLVAGEKKI